MLENHLQTLQYESISLFYHYNILFCKLSEEDPCDPDPCVAGQSLGCMNINNILCYCKLGYAGPTCAESKWINMNTMNRMALEYFLNL